MSTSRLLCPSLAVVLLAVAFPLSAQEVPETAERQTRGVAVSVNPLGFVQFGPLINVEFGLREDVAVLLHTRLVPLGVLSYVVAEGPDNLSGIGFGAGLLRFLGDGTNRPYLGGSLEYAITDASYDTGFADEWSEQSSSITLITNAGYRFGFDEGLFLNTGVFLGAAFSRWNWEYTDVSFGASDPEPRSGTGMLPFGMFEVAIGMEF